MYNSFQPNPMTMNGQFPNMYPSQRQEIVKVNGEGGARAYQLFPNSSALLLDENNPLVWLVQTDGAGYKTVTPYTITPYKPAPMVNIDDLNARLAKVEEIVNAKSYSANAQPKKSDDADDFNHQLG